jgi:hypothetical protein
VSDETQDLDEMLGFLAEDGRDRRDPEEHPSPEALSAYQANELTPEEDERIQDHLAVCQHCTELLLDLEELLKPPAAAAEPAADFEAAADWKRLREGMGPVVGKPEPLRAKAPEQQDYRLVRSLQVYRALAAVLGFIVVGLSLYTVRPPGEPEILPPSISIDFETTRGSGTVEPLKVRLPFSLGFYTAPSYPSYRIEIVDVEGKPRYSRETTLSEGLIPMQRGFLPPGEYEIRFSGLKGGKSEPIGRPGKVIIQP